MLANVFTKALMDRWRAMAVASASLGAMLWFGMIAYDGLDLSVYSDLPEVMRSLIGIADDIDAGGLAYGAIYASYGTLTLASVALSMGAATIAGEERDRTLGLLLGAPMSRGQVLRQKCASMVVLTAGGALVLWIAGVAVPLLIDVDTSGKHVEALVIHMFVAAVFFGALAAAIGGWTGRRALASGTTALVMVASFIGAGVFPVLGWGDAAKILPWYYFDGSDPVTNGLDWGHLGVLAGAAALLMIVAVVGVDRRDLGSGESTSGILDRLREHPLAKKVIDRIAGSARVSSLWAKTVSDHQMVTIVVGYSVVFFGVVLGPMYLTINDALKDFMRQVPEAILAMVGYADMGTPEGWYQTEHFSLTVPIALIIATVAVGSKALAGEEADRTMGLLLANPVRRSRVVVEKSFAMIVIAGLLGVLTFIGTMIGSAISGLGMGVAGVAATSVLGSLIGLVFGALALAVGAATGRTTWASAGAAGAALMFYIVNAFFPLADSLEVFADWSPFHYYLSADPLNNGMPWGHAAILAALTVALMGGAVLLFERRDLRQGA